MSTNKWLYKQIVPYTPNGLLLRNEKEQMTDTHNMDEPQNNHME